MNLIQHASDLKELNKKLNLKSDKTTDSKYIIRNWLEMSNTLNKLLEVNFLSDQVKNIFSIDDNMNIRINDWVTTPQTHQLLSYKLETLRISIDACIKLISEYTDEVSDITEGNGFLNTRMPDAINMKKMSKICDDLDKVFNQCPLIKDEIKFIGVEKGSVYFVFLTTLLSITMVGKILNAALDVQRRYYQNEMMKIKLETMRNIGDVGKQIIENLEIEIKAFSREKALEIEEAQNLDPEDVERLTLSIRTLSSLIGQGVQMQCALYGEQEASNISFPSTEEFKNLIDGLKLLNGN